MSRHLYPHAGRHAQPEVKQAIARFMRLPAVEKSAEVLLYWLLGDGTPPFKADRTDSRYTPTSAVDGQTCGNCRFAYQNVVQGSFICSQIRGGIVLGGWCRRWVA